MNYYVIRTAVVRLCKMHTYHTPLTEENTCKGMQLHVCCNSTMA